jgi:hypothetical protein
LLKADRIVVALERLEDGKTRATTTTWDDAKLISPNQVLAVASIGKQVGLVRVDKSVAYLDIDDTACSKRVTVPLHRNARDCNAVTESSHEPT